MKNIAAFLGCLILTCIHVKAQHVSLNQQEILQLKRVFAKDEKVKAFVEDFKRRADDALNDEPNPVEKIRSQGLLQGDPLKTRSLKAVEDAAKIYALALTSKLYRRQPYQDKARDFLLAWARINQATGDPIDETKLEDAIVGYDLIRSDLEKADRDVIDSWMEKIADAEMNSIYASPERSTSKNNWNSHRIKIITQIAHAIHSTKFDKFIVQELDSHLVRNLNADGSSFDFHERDALHYHIYTLEPLLKAIIVLERATGKDYFSYVSRNGSSIKKSVDFLVPYVSGKKRHVEFANSRVAFDRARAKNNEKGYQPADFVPAKGIVVLSLASYFDPAYIKMIKRTPGAASDYIDWQLILNRVRK